MALELNFKRLILQYSKKVKFICVRFRDMEKTLYLTDSDRERVTINRVIEFPVNPALVPGDEVTIELYKREKSDIPILMGHFTLRMLIVFHDGQFLLSDCLINTKRRTAPAFLEVLVYYIPVNLMNEREPLKYQGIINRTTIGEIQRRRNYLSGFERIAHPELKLYECLLMPAVSPFAQRLIPHPKRNTIPESGPEPEIQNQPEEIEDDEDDEDTIYLDELDRNIASADIEPNAEPGSSSWTTADVRRTIEKIPRDYQICVTIIEARQLNRLTMDPVVCVQVGQLQESTVMKRDGVSLSPHFVFEFNSSAEMLFDKIITITVLQPRTLLRTLHFIGSFKLDVSTLWNQPDRQFYHKWAILTDPDDTNAVPKGYLKCDISIVCESDILKVPPRNDVDEDDIKANLLLPSGMTARPHRACFCIIIYKADGLPKMNYSLLANVKKALTGESHTPVDPYVEVNFAGNTGCTSIRKNCYSPVWNEQIVFTEMFPPMCQLLKIQLKDDNAVNPGIIGTHFIDLSTISHAGDRGFSPTFGPAYIHMYGSTREYSQLDQQSTLNTGIGEGVSYRGRLLIEIRTDIIEIIANPSTDVVIRPVIEANERAYEKHEEFFLFGCLFDANLIDKQFSDKPIQFELSIGNTGNIIDGNKHSLKSPLDLNVQDLNDINADTGFWRSVSRPTKASTKDKVNYFLPYSDNKHCMHILSIWPDHRNRMYNSNMISKIIEEFEEGLDNLQNIIKMNDEPEGSGVEYMISVLDSVSTACINYLDQIDNLPIDGGTELDRKRHKLCISEIESVCSLTIKLKALVTNNSIKDRIRTAYSYLNRLKHLCEDPQHAMPDVLIWMISNGKRLAYHRFRARDLIFSASTDECGKLCGKMQTIFLKWPVKNSTPASGWSIPAKITIFLWLGMLKDKKHFLEKLPIGYDQNYDVKNAEEPRAIAPELLLYTEKHCFQMRAYIYQARSLIGSDASGLSDLFARVVIGDISATTQVIDASLSPTWDELLTLDGILVCSTIERIKADPPTIVIEFFDQDKVGNSEFIGRTLAKPTVKSWEDICARLQPQPSLEWHEITRGDVKAGELLATFEIIENAPNGKPSELLPPPDGKVEVKTDTNERQEMKSLQIPSERHTLLIYRVEVIYWGLRDLKRLQHLKVDRTRAGIESTGHLAYPGVIQNAQRNTNFPNPIKHIDVELPDQDLYRPPLPIRVVDWSSFDRNALVGTHSINFLNKYIYMLKSIDERETGDRQKSIIDLQKVDLKANRIIQEDEYAVETKRDLCPLLIPEGRIMTYGSGIKLPMNKKIALREISKKRTVGTDDVLDDDDSSKDWWTKYFVSVETMIENKNKRDYLRPPQIANIEETRSPREEVYFSRYEGDLHDPQPSTSQGATTSPLAVPNKNEIPRSAMIKIYPHELEAIPEYEEFKEWLNSFELYRGKKTGGDKEDDNRVAGVFKGDIKVYKWPLPRGIDDQTIMGFDPNNGFSQGIPNNDPIHVLVRVYIVKATDLHPMDLNGKADPYISLQLGSKNISDKENYVSKQLNPVFGKCFEIKATFPQDSMLNIQILDWDLVGPDDLIGETKINLENRFYSHHRATCGLPMKYEEQGYNRWRDAMKPTQILAKLCKENKLNYPVYDYGKVTIGKTIFNMTMHDEALFSNNDTIEEQMALGVLRRWQEVPRVGTSLVTEHVETRSLYNPNKPGIEHGRLEMWVDMFPMDMPLPGPPVDIAAREPKAFELRVIIWNTDDVVLQDDEFFTGEKMSDIYVKGWLREPDDCQCTDIYYHSLAGEGYFNWRFIYPFEYLEAEERIVTSSKDSVFSWDQTERKIPARLELQVWDSDHVLADDFLGAITLDLNRFPRGAKSSKLCNVEMLKTDGSVPMVNLFKEKHVRGWWPIYVKRNTDKMELTGKLEVEIHLLTKEEAEMAPAGLGRSEPDPIEKPK